ncbi:MAG: undecaprenyl-diphosphate phosphatase [Bacteroidetes bacterium]|nr:undecaprenyl-diphosphate phosphatase [Bacteroidota bacterium]
MSLFEAIIVAIVEGLTEYLPVSSTAHMIFTSAWFGNEDDSFVKMFQVSIQFGAILSIVVLYWRKFFDFSQFNFYIKLGFAVLPALILGYLFDDIIESVLEKPVPIALVMVIGGIILLFIDKLFTTHEISDEKSISIKTAVVIGFWQCLAMMPGVSRSAASIIGGMQQKLKRTTAAEFSFFLAVPTMLAVTVYSVFVKDWNYMGAEMKGFDMILYSGDNIKMFVIGNIVAFTVALIAVKSFVGFLNTYGFKPFGWYRIIVGILILIAFS